MPKQRIPPGPDEPYDSNRELLDWIGDQFGRFGDIYRASIYTLPAYVTRDPDHAEHVLRDNWRNYVKGQAVKRVGLLLGNGLIVSEGGLWKRQRRMIQPAFQQDGAENLVRIAKIANERLLKNWETAALKCGPVNVTVDISRMVLDVVIGSIFGDDSVHMRQHFSVLSETSRRGLEFAQTFRSLGRLVLDAVHRRREQEIAAYDILAALMQARDPMTGRGMADRQLLNEVMTLIVAGHETTALTLNWVWYLLSQHPEAQEKLAHELKTHVPSNETNLEDLSRLPCVRQVIEEALRLYPPVWLITRKALADDQLGDYFVPAGTEIHLPIYFIQRHPELWHEPDSFNPDRFGPEKTNNRHRLAMIPFSAGPRNCIGETFARVEMQIHLMMAARKFKMRYIPTKPLDLEPGVNLRNKYDFIMIPERIHSD
jgi:cytochrome P450